MIVKILGGFDILASLVILIFPFVTIPTVIVWIFIIGLLAKGGFVLTKSIASLFDIFAALILILGIFFAIPKVLFLIAGFLVLQKGFLSLL